MYHTIEFAEEFVPDLQLSRLRPVQQALIRSGTRLQAEVQPYVLDAEEGLIEVADLFFSDGTIICRVPMESFSFVE